MQDDLKLEHGLEGDPVILQVVEGHVPHVCRVLVQRAEFHLVVLDQAVFVLVAADQLTHSS